MLAAGAALAVYAALIGILVVLGRRTDARALAGFIPDFLPVVGQLDDAIIVGLVLRSVLRAAGPELVHEHWRGPPSSRDLVLRLAGGQGRRPDRASASR